MSQYSNTYTRRDFGTFLVSLLCLFELLLVVGSLYGVLGGGDFSFFAWLLLTFLYKFVFHAWILKSPSLTAGNGDTLKLNIFLIGTLVLQSLAALDRVLVLEDNEGKIVIAVIFFALSAFVVFERFAFASSDDSPCCLKHWKPWAIANEADVVTYDRRLWGTTHMILVCALNLVLMALIVINLDSNDNDSTDDSNEYFDYLQLAIFLSALYKLGTDLWVLSSPSATFGTGEVLKLNIFLGGTLLLNLAPIIAFKAQDTAGLLSWMLMAFFALPSFFAIFQRIIFSYPEESTCCLKHWKPWKIHEADEFQYKRRIVGTIFVSLTSVVYFAIGFLLLVAMLDKLAEDGDIEADDFITFALALFYGFIKFVFSMGYLLDPTITAGKGHTVNLNANLVISFVFPVASLVISYIFDNELIHEEEKIVILGALLFLAVFERIVYGTDDDSSSCLKYWKPWFISQKSTKPDYEA